jgi:hypothetical protein
MDDLKLRQNWKKTLWNDHCRQEQIKYLSFSENELINELEKQNFGEYYMIWTAIKLKGTEKMIVPLFDTVKLFSSRNDFLKRFHSTDALFYLLDLDDHALENQVTGNIMLFDKVMFEKGIEKLAKIIKNRK